MLNTTDAKNLSKNRFIELANDIVYDFANVNTNITETILHGTSYKDVKNLFYVQPLSSWDEDTRSEVIEAIVSSESELINIDEYFNLESDVSDHFDSLDINIENDNFLDAEDSIIAICDHLEFVINKFKEAVPDIDLDMPNYFNDHIMKAAEKFDTMSSSQFKLNKEPKEWHLDSIAKSAPDISIVEFNDSFYITSNSSEVNKLQIAYAYCEIDEAIPKEITDSINLLSDEAKLYTFTDGLKKFIAEKDDLYLNTAPELRNVAIQEINKTTTALNYN